VVVVIAGTYPIAPRRAAVDAVWRIATPPAAHATRDPYAIDGTRGAPVETSSISRRLHRSALVMLWNLSALLLTLWLMAFITGPGLTPWVHLLLVLAIVAAGFRLVQDRLPPR
jgi:hypothetical protein